MRKIAVMDVGSNSVRLMTIADGKVLYKTIKTTQLGEGIAFSSMLKTEAMERTVSALNEFCERAKSENVDEIYAFATASVRSAKNGAEFCALVRERCGIKLEVVSGEEEANLGLIGALGNEDGAIIDVGGASTELIVRQNGQVVYGKSLDIGIVRLKDLCGRDRALIRAFCEKSVEEFGFPQLPQRIFAIGGTATTLSAIELGLKEYDGKKVTGTEISLKAMKELSNRLFSLTVEEISQIPCVDGLRAEVIAGGAEWFCVMMEKLGIEKIGNQDVVDEDHVLDNEAAKVSHSMKLQFEYMGK